jgi:hypothetical protein
VHHTYVVVYHRFKEDGETIAIHTEYGITSATNSSAEHRNPSGRRGGIAIGFYCESCDDESELTIEQHKGNTFVQWREKTLPPDQMFSRKESVLTSLNPTL